MTATPADLAVGFSLCEGIVASPAGVEAPEIVPLDDGIEPGMDLKDELCRCLAFAGGTSLALPDAATPRAIRATS